MPETIPTPLTSGATDQGGPNGIPPSPTPQSQPASDAAMVAQDVANKYPNNPPAMPNGTPQMPTLATQPNTPNQSTTAPNLAPTPHEALYSKFLKMLNPPTRFVDENGVQQSQPQTGKNIGNNVLAAVLAGMMTPTKYREGAYGPVVDSSGTAAAAFQAGQKQKTDQNEQAQKLSIDQQTRKLATAKNTIDLIHLWAATSHEMGQDAQAQVDNYAPTLKIAQDHDQNLQDGDTKAVLASGMTMAEAMKHPEFKDALTSHSIMPDGVIEVDDGQGHMIPTQTFSVIDPNVSVSMDKDSVAIVSQINPQWKEAFEKSGGSMKMRLGQIQAVTNQVNSVQYAERFFNDAAQSDDAAVKALGLKGDINGEIMSAVRNGAPGAPQALKALMAMENAKAQGGTGIVDSLDRLIHDPDNRAGAGYILAALGTTSDKVDKFVRDSRLEQERQNALAKEGGLGEKAPGAQDQINKLVDSVQPGPNLDADDSKALMADVPAKDKNGNINMTQGQIEKLTARRDAVVASNKGIAERNALANGDPVAMKQTADDIIGGDFDDLAAIASKRGNALQNAVHATHAEAERRGLDTTQFSEPALRAKANMWQDYSGGLKTPTGKQLTSFDALLGHLSALDTSMKPLESKTLGLTHQPIVNMAMKDIAKQLTDDKDWKQFEFAMEPVKQEMSNFLAAGYAVKAEDAAKINAVLNDTLPLNQVKGVMTQMAHTADVRLAALGKTYVNTMGTTYPDLISTDGKNTLKNLGVTSQADRYSQTIPRGWVGDQPTRLDPKAPQNQALMKQILGAAGNDPAKALNIAKLNGYIF